MCEAGPAEKKAKFNLPHFGSSRRMVGENLKYDLCRLLISFHFISCLSFYYLSSAKYSMPVQYSEVVICNVGDMLIRW